MIKELAEEFVARGHSVTVATTWPRFNLDSKAQQKKFTEYSIESNVHVIRVKGLAHHNVNYLMRGLAELSLPYIILKKIRLYCNQNFDVTIVFSPPLSLSVVGENIRKKMGGKYIFYITDIFPQNAIDLGVIKNNLLIKIFEWIEKGIYKNADMIIPNSKNYVNFLTEKKSVPDEKIAVIHNWIDVDVFKNTGKQNIFRKKFGLNNKFIFLFAGILGPSQNLDFIINIAKEITDIPEIHFLLVGEGSEKNRLQQLVLNYRLQNVTFEPFVSYEEYPLLAKEVDVGLVCLSNKNKTPIIPGKILGFMASAIPVVAFLNKESDAHDIIKESRCGYSMVSDNQKKAEGLIREMYKEKYMLAQNGQNGYNYLLTHFTKKLCIDKLESLLFRHI